MMWFIERLMTVLLVDFDGVGKHGEDRYSACLNEDTPLGVRRLQIMEKSHDEENLERLIYGTTEEVNN
jgi:hypothetical protein